VLTVVGWGASFLDRWLLQVVGGSAEQGYYSLSYNWSQLLLIFVSSATGSYWREIGSANSRNDVAQMRHLHIRFTRLLAFSVSYFSAFTCFQAEFIITKVAGHEFEGAILPFVLLSFYPVLQVYGQLNTALLMATDRTRTSSLIGYVTMAIGLVATYACLAPKDFLIPGLELGAFGLSLRMLVIACLSVTICVVVNCRFLAESIGKQLVHLFGVLAVTLGLASGAIWVTSWAATSLSLPEPWQSWSAFLLSGMLYSLLVAAIVWTFPVLVGMRRDEVAQLLVQARNRLPFSRNRKMDT
jgi:hypothetical protein